MEDFKSIIEKMKQLLTEAYNFNELEESRLSERESVIFRKDREKDEILKAIRVMLDAFVKSSPNDYFVFL